MPDRPDSLLRAFQKMLRLNLPEAPAPLSPGVEAMYEAERKQKENQWRQEHPIKAGISDVVGSGLDFLGGLTGLKSAESIKENPATAYGELAGGLTDLIPGKAALTGVAKAGLPFLAYAPRVFHGTQRDFLKFDPKVYDKSDVLGWMTHAAADPEYAGIGYALGQSKHGSTSKKGAQIFPIEPKAENVLDLVEPNMDDLAQTIAAMNPEKRRRVIDNYKRFMRDKERATEIVKADQYGVTSLEEQLQDYFNHHIDLSQLDESDYPAQYLADNLRLSESEFERTPFDAIRYRDMANESWAIPKTTPIKSSISEHYFIDPSPESPIKGLKVSPEETLGESGAITKVNKKLGKMFTKNQLDNLYENGKISEYEYNKAIEEFFADKSFLEGIFDTSPPVKPAEVKDFGVKIGFSADNYNYITFDKNKSLLEALKDLDFAAKQSPQYYPPDVFEQLSEAITKYYKEK